MASPELLERARGALLGPAYGLGAMPEKWRSSQGLLAWRRLELADQLVALAPTSGLLI